MSELSGPKVTRRGLIPWARPGAASRRAPQRSGRATTGWAGRRNALLRAGKKVIIIGIDGMDPPAFGTDDEGGASCPISRSRAGGGLSPPGTSAPPQSPVAWANFINGAGPGDHGIFDFIHRHPQE